MYGAQLEIIKNYFDPNGNKYKTGFEGSSKRRGDLRELIKNYSATSEITSIVGLTPESQFFPLPLDTFLIVHEVAKVTSTDSCINNTYLDVVPKTFDEFNIQYKSLSYQFLLFIIICKIKHNKHLFFSLHGTYIRFIL